MFFFTRVKDTTAYNWNIFILMKIGFNAVLEEGLW